MYKRISRTTKYIIYAVVLGIVAVVIYFLLENYAKTSANPVIEFSHDSGFYSDDFDVEVSVGKNYFLTYTLDGTNPTLQSQRYEGPIHISDASENDNVFSENELTSAKYFDWRYDYSIPSEKMDKCTLLRVCAFDYSGNKVSGAVREYLVGFDDRAGYDGLYTVCVSTDPENLFNESVGIYVFGEYFHDMIDSGKIYEYEWEEDDAWDLECKANWFKDGPDSERVGTVEVFDAQNNKILSTNCGIRIRGYGSRHFPQKSIGLYAREEYGDGASDRFGYDFFGEGIGPRKIVLSNSGNDCDVKLLDYVIYNLLSGGKNTFPDTMLIPCNVFLEGEYWGPMYITQDLNNDYIASCYGVTPDNVRLIKSGEFKGDDLIAESGVDVEDWDNLVDFIRENSMSVQENYDYVCSKMDINNFAEYAATEVFIGNIDWHTKNNFACWRTAKSEKGNEYSDGKWRFCLFDVNWSMTTQEEVMLNLEDDWDFYQMVQKLGENEEFENLFKKKIEELELLFSEDNVSEIINEWQSVMGAADRKYYERFASEADVEANIEMEKNRIIDFCTRRPGEMKELYNYFFCK